MSGRCLVAFTTKPPGGRPVEVQVAVDGAGTPYVWIREEGQRAAIARGVRALEQLADGLARALRASGRIPPAQLTLILGEAGGARRRSERRRAAVRRRRAA